MATGLVYSDPSVLYFSIHEYPHYPGTGSKEERGPEALKSSAAEHVKALLGDG
ncbi:MAG: hypothetical protein HZA77_00075 [Candidatus Schekmanbacteria bacterium]|nr:hypothetical protein [Candidatus Schekmanbacteria bacterium]